MTLLFPPAPPSMPHEAVRTSLGSDESMRLLHSAGAKPPKTTVWMAPRCVIASRAIWHSGIMGTGGVGG